MMRRPATTWGLAILLGVIALPSVARADDCSFTSPTDCYNLLMVAIIVMAALALLVAVGLELFAGAAALDALAVAATADAAAASSLTIAGEAGVIAESAAAVADASGLADAAVTAVEASDGAASSLRAAQLAAAAARGAQVLAEMGDVAGSLAESARAMQLAAEANGYAMGVLADHIAISQASAAMEAGLAAQSAAAQSLVTGIADALAAGNPQAAADLVSALSSEGGWGGDAPQVIDTARQIVVDMLRNSQLSTADWFTLHDLMQGVLQVLG